MKRENDDSLAHLGGSDSSSRSYLGIMNEVRTSAGEVEECDQVAMRGQGNRDRG